MREEKLMRLPLKLLKNKKKLMKLPSLQRKKLLKLKPLKRPLLPKH